MPNEQHPDVRLTERRNPRTLGIDAASPLEIVDLVNTEDALVAPAVAAAREPIALAIELAERAIRQGGRLFYVGAGTSGRLGVLDASECPPTFGTDPGMVQGIIAGGSEALVRSIEGAEDDPAAGAAALDARNVDARDFVVGIAASGTTPYVRGALERARAVGAAVGFVTCAEPSPELRELCDTCIVALVGPEVVTGSTRMKAGTATKLVLNTISTGTMIRLGKTWGNLMVDLRAWNEKLVDRSQRIVMEATGLPRAEARAAIAAAGGEVKLAIVMARRQVERDEAARMLAEHGGSMRAVLGAPPPVRAE